MQENITHYTTVHQKEEFTDTLLGTGVFSAINFYCQYPHTHANCENTTQRGKRRKGGKTQGTHKHILFAGIILKTKAKEMHNSHTQTHSTGAALHHLHCYHFHHKEHTNWEKRQKAKKMQWWCASQCCFAESLAWVPTFFLGTVWIFFQVPNCTIGD